MRVKVRVRVRKVRVLRWQRRPVGERNPQRRAVAADVEGAGRAGRGAGLVCVPCVQLQCGVGCDGEEGDGMPAMAGCKFELMSPAQEALDEMSVLCWDDVTSLDHY
jgi:hypothetical protein